MNKAVVLPDKNLTFMSREHTGMLRGLAILLIMLVHFFNIYTSFGYTSMFAGVGVSIFLIISGYGINESYTRKGFNHYFTDKIIKIYLPCLFVFLLFSVIKGTLTLHSFAKGLLLIGAQASWYLQFLFILYTLFFISVKLFKEKRWIFWLLIPIAFIFIKSQLWAEQAMAFSLGVLASVFDWKSAVGRISKFKAVLLCIALIFISGIAFALRHKLHTVYVLNNIDWMLFKTSLAVFVIIITWLVSFRITTWAFNLPGKISFALYLIHLYIFELIFAKGLSAVKIIIAFALTTALSILYTMLINKTYEIVKRRRKNVKT